MLSLTLLSDHWNPCSLFFLNKGGLATAECSNPAKPYLRDTISAWLFWLSPNLTKSKKTSKTYLYFKSLFVIHIQYEGYWLLPRFLVWSNRSPRVRANKIWLCHFKKLSLHVWYEKSDLLGTDNQTLFYFV